ncbi:OmpH family outer membrane protein [candidate division WOR-3 bacterium]|nr:OmpH family outer membrane protein [candidate division WOR-3 bacterium]
MKKIFGMLILLTILGFTKDEKIGFVDSRRIMEQYQATAAAKVDFNEFVQSYRDSASVLRQNIENIKSELEAEKLVLSEEARLRKLDEIEQLQTAYGLFLESVFGTGGKVDQKNDELMTPLLKKVNDAVKKTAEQEGFTIVLDLSEGVYYANNDLDLTEMVINELNLEYGPQTIPGVEEKKTIAVFPFREENTEAASDNSGEWMQDQVYRALANFTKQYEIVLKNKISFEIVNRGYGINLEETQAFTIARALQCDYFFIGTVTKFGNRINYTMSLKDVATNTEIDKKSNDATEETKLVDFLNNDFRALLEKLQEE